MIKQLLLMRKKDADILNFNISADSDKWTITKNIFFIVIMFIVGRLQYSFSLSMKNAGSDLSVMLLIFYMATSIVELIFSIIRSSNILFSSKDNNLLLSLPIRKHHIVISRVILLMISQYVINIILMIPALIVYSILEKPLIHFYLSGAISILLLPIIPTILGSIISYIIEIITNKFKNKNLAQIILTVFVVVMVFVLLFNVDKLTIEARSLNEFLLKLYYPLGTFIMSCTELANKEVLFTVLLNCILLFAYIGIINIFFIKILKVNLESRKKKKSEKLKYRKRKKIISLLNKEIKRYLSKPIYILNTLLLPVIFLAGAVYLNYIGVDSVCEFLKSDVESVQRLFVSFLPALFCMVASTGNTTSVSITLEGKFNWINKSLPITFIDIIKGKILLSQVVILPIILVAIIILLAVLKLDIILSILIITTCLAITNFIFILGLLINLIVPDMDFVNEGLAIKQSKSALSTTIISVVLAALISWLYNKIEYQYVYVFFILITIAFIILQKLAWKILNNQGKYRYDNMSN